MSDATKQKQLEWRRSFLTRTVASDTPVKATYLVFCYRRPFIFSECLEDQNPLSSLAFYLSHYLPPTQANYPIGSRTLNY